MAKKFLTSINLLQNELQNAVFQNLSVAPANPKQGQFYYDTAKKKFGVFEDTAWSYFNNAEEMAAALALKLDVATYNEYVAANNERVKAVEDDLAAYKGEVADALALKADKAYTGTIITDGSATELADAVSEIAGQVNTNTANIATLNGGAEVSGSVDNKIETALGDITSENYVNASATVNANISALDEAVADVEAGLGAISVTVDGEAGTATVTKGETSFTTYTKDKEDALLGTKVDNTTYNQYVEENNAAVASKVSQAVYDAKIAELEKADSDDAKALADYKAEMVETLKGKADVATTLAGYGITDAYTKQEVDAKVASVYKFKGSVETFGDLPAEGNIEGDVYNVKSTGENYAWVAATETEEGFWDDLGGDIDLTPYLTKEDAAATYETIANVAKLKTDLEKAIDDAKTEVTNASAHKKSFLNPELTPAGGVATWSVAHTLGEDVVVTIKEIATGDEVFADVAQANNVLTIKINAESTVAANSYKVILVG